MTTSPLRIAMLSVHSCPLGQLGAEDTGGMSVYVREVARELGKLGLAVDIYTRVHDIRDKQTYDIGPNARLIHLRAGDDADLHKLELYRHLPQFAVELQSFRRNSGLDYDLIFSHYWLSGWVGESLQRWWHVPHMTMFHTLGAVKNALGIGEKEPAVRLDTERRLMHVCRRVITATEREKGHMIQYYDAPKETIAVVPCGVNLDLFRPIAREAAKSRLGLNGEKVILFVGRIQPLKGIDQLIRAMTCFPGEEKLRLVIIGGDEHSQGELKRLKGLVCDLHLEDTVSFPGMTKHDNLPYYYSAAEVCVIPSYYESFGLVALESLACGTPVVTTDVGDFKNIIHEGETGYVVPDNTPANLAGGILSVLSKPALTYSDTNAIRRSVVRFDWSNIARAVAKECQQVANGHYASVR